MKTQWIQPNTKVNVRFLQQNPETASASFVDLQIGEEVKTLQFGATQGYVASSFHLKESKQVFPQIETILIEPNVLAVEFPNAMFPNVKQVVSHNARYLSGSMLVEKSRIINGKRRRALQNAFIQTPDVVLDMYGITEITADALAGCKATHAINTGKITVIAKNALLGSSFYQTPFQRGIQTFGSILLDIDPEAEEVYLPRWLTLNYMNVMAPNGHKFSQVKRLVIETCSQSILKILLREDLPEILYIEDIDQTKDWHVTSFFAYNNCCYAKNIELLKSERYTARNGMLYNKEGTSLIVAPLRKAGIVQIPEGTERIEYHAFYLNICLTGVVMPSSLKVIEGSAFGQCCNLESVQLNQGLTTIWDHAFSGCKALPEIDIPGSVKTIGRAAFSEALELKRVLLHEGTETIEPDVFVGCYNLESLEIPSTVVCLGSGSLWPVFRIYLHTEELPKDIIEAVVNEPSLCSQDFLSYVTIQTPTMQVFIPKKMKESVRSSFNELVNQTKAVPLTAHQYASNQKTKYYTAFLNYLQTKDEALAQYTRKISGKLAEWLSAEDLRLLVINHLATKRAMDKIRERPDMMQDATLNAYLLEETKTLPGSSLKL